jgi:predicted DNA-binding protein (MmcQ/YjbR family)
MEEVDRMKKVFGNIVLFLSMLLVSLVAMPWNNLTQWWLPDIPFLSNNELYIKAGIGGLMLIFGIIFLIVANREYREYGHTTPATSGYSFIPLFMYTFASLGYAAIISLFVYSANPGPNNLYFVIGLGAVMLNVLIFGHMLSAAFRKQKNFGRVMIFIFLVELMLISMGAAYFVREILIADSFYQSMYTFLYIALLGVGIVFYIIHVIILKSKRKHHSEEVALEAEIDDIRGKKSSVIPEAPSKKAKKGDIAKQTVTDNGKKTMIVSREQTVVSGEQNLDPTNMLYEDVDVDPEFSKTSNQEKQVSSIEYYIEKPKMFKPLDPTFDKLVEYVREMPQVVTKISDEKITFYVDRKPFIVLMNYGNYYRIAFKSELEKGIRLIIKYPTISKNKSTRDDLWFKANNYGDLPKDVIYQIVKSAYDNVNA